MVEEPQTSAAFERAVALGNRMREAAAKINEEKRDLRGRGLRRYVGAIDESMGDLMREVLIGNEEEKRAVANANSIRSFHEHIVADEQAYKELGQAMAKQLYAEIERGRERQNLMNILIGKPPVYSLQKTIIALAIGGMFQCPN